MKLDTTLLARHLNDAPGVAKAAEEAGFDAIWTAEAGSDAFLPAALAAEHTKKAKIGTAVAIAFPRSPMATAQVAWDLAGLSERALHPRTRHPGQRPHRAALQHQVGCAGAEPARVHPIVARDFRMLGQRRREAEVRGQVLQFLADDAVLHTAETRWPNIPIYIAGLNEHILRLAGEACDGLHAHPFNSPKYLADYVLPHVDQGLKKSGRDRKNFTIATIAFAIVGHNKEEQDKVRAQVRQQISFYASTRTYRIVLETHGWGPVADRLNEKAAKGQWAAMANEITDEMLDVYSVTGTWDDIGDKLKRRYDGLLDRVAFYMPYHPGKNETEWRKLTKQFNG